MQNRSGWLLHGVHSAEILILIEMSATFIVNRKWPILNLSCMLLKQLLLGLQPSTFTHPIPMSSFYQSGGMSS